MAEITVCLRSVYVFNHRVPWRVTVVFRLYGLVGAETYLADSCSPLGACTVVGGGFAYDSQEALGDAVDDNDTGFQILTVIAVPMVDIVEVPA